MKQPSGQASTAERVRRAAIARLDTHERAILAWLLASGAAASADGGAVDLSSHVAYRAGLECVRAAIRARIDELDPDETGNERLRSDLVRLAERLTGAVLAELAAYDLRVRTRSGRRRHLRVVGGEE